MHRGGGQRPCDSQERVGGMTRVHHGLRPRWLQTRPTLLNDLSILERPQTYILEPLSGPITLTVMRSSVRAKQAKTRRKISPKLGPDLQGGISALPQHRASPDARYTGTYLPVVEVPNIKSPPPPTVTRSSHGKTSAGTGKNSDGIG